MNRSAFVPDVTAMLRQMTRDARSVTRVFTKVTKAIPYGDGPHARISAVLGEVARRHPRLFDSTALQLDCALAREVGR